MAINPNPFLRVRPLGVIQEPASTFFCFVLLVQSIICLRRILSIRSRLPTPLRSSLHRHRHRIDLWLALTVVWVVAYLGSVLFHIHETKLTEQMDYFGAFGAILMSTLVAAFRLSSETRAVTISLVGVGMAVVLPHVGYMTFVLFDYGWHVKLCTWIAVSHIALWMAWWRINHRRPHRHLVAVSQLLLVVGAPLEMFDFRPLWGHFDAHSLWHAVGIVIAGFYLVFVARDSQFELNHAKIWHDANE